MRRPFNNDQAATGASGRHVSLPVTVPGPWGRSGKLPGPSSKPSDWTEVGCPQSTGSQPCTSQPDGDRSSPRKGLRAPLPEEARGALSGRGGGRASRRTMGPGEGESVGVPGCLAIAINLITLWSPRPPLALPKASAAPLLTPTWREKLLSPPLYF